MRQPASASATPAANPASPPPITITFFEDIFPCMPPEACTGDEEHFFRLAQADPFVENREIERLDAPEERVVGVDEQPQRAAAVGVDQVQKLGAFFIELESSFSFNAEQFANTERTF